MTRPAHSHSPGPFSLADGNCGHLCGVLDANGKAIAMLGVKANLKPEDIALFLAAPALLEALQEMLDIEELASTNGVDGERAEAAIDAARAAITAATTPTSSQG